MTALEIIARSHLMHPTLFREALDRRAAEDLAFANSRDNAAIRRSVMASHDQAKTAIAYLDSGNLDGFAANMGAGIIALNVACKLQCLPAHVRTAAAVAQWES